MILNNNSPLPYRNIPVIKTDIKPNLSENTPASEKVKKTDKTTPNKENPQELKKKYEKFVKEIAKYSVNMNNFDFEHMLKNVFDIGGKLALKPEDILANKEVIKKFLPKVGEFLEKADKQYNDLQKSAKTDGETQLSFTNGKIIFKTGQNETQLDSNGNIVPVTNEAKVKTETELDLAGLAAGIKAIDKEGNNFGAKADIDDKRLNFNIRDKNGAGQTTTIDLKTEGFNTNFSPDGKNHIGLATQGNGYSSMGVKHNGVGSVNIAGGAKKGTIVSVNSDKLGGAQVSGGKNQQTVVRTNLKTKEGEFGTSLRTGNNQGTQVGVQTGKFGGANFGINSNGIKVGANLNGTGATFGVSRSNNAVNQSIDKEGKVTTSITDDNKWDTLVTYKDQKFGTIGLNFSKRKADTHTLISNNSNDDIKCKQEKIKSLEEENKKLSDIPKSKRNNEQKDRMESIKNEIEVLEIDIVSQGENIEAKTKDLMFVGDENDNEEKKSGHEIAKTISKGDIYKLNQERKLTYGAEAGIAGNNAKASNTISKNIDIDLSIEGLGDNKVKISASRKTEIDNKSNVNVASGVATYEAEFENDKSVSYEVVIDLNTQEGKKLYDEIMISSSGFKDKLPLPKESQGISILNLETEDLKTKQSEKELKVSNVVDMGIKKEHQISKTINLDNYEMTGDFTKTSTIDGDKIDVIGQVFSDEKVTANGSYTISKEKKEQLKDLENKKHEIKTNALIPESEKDSQIKSVDNKIEHIKDLIDENNKSIEDLETKKEDLISKQNLSSADKELKISKLTSEIEEKTKNLRNETDKINKEKEKINNDKKSISINNDIPKADKDLKIMEADNNLKSLNAKLNSLSNDISALESERLELSYTPQETKSQINKLNAQIKELSMEYDKTTFKVTIEDSKVRRGEIKAYTETLNALTDSHKTTELQPKEYNDKSAISIIVELFADKKDVDKIINSTKEQFLDAAYKTPGISRNGDGVRLLERKINKSEEEAIKDADQKGLKNPSPERDALIRSSMLDAVMKFVERNGKSGIAMLQTLTNGGLEVKKAQVEISGFKANNIISEDRINQINNRNKEVNTDNKLDKKELKDIKKMLKEALEKQEELKDRFIKINNNPLLEPSQKLDLRKNLELKLLKVQELISKLESTKKIIE